MKLEIKTSDNKLISFEIKDKEIPRLIDTIYWLFRDNKVDPKITIPAPL